MDVSLKRGICEGVIVYNSQKGGRHSCSLACTNKTTIKNVEKEQIEVSKFREHKSDHKFML